MDRPPNTLFSPQVCKQETLKHTILLSYQSLGVVFGRLITAPLYVFGSILPHDIESSEKVYELFSFVFWTLTIISLLKYALLVLRADDNGEGGTFSLYSLLCRHAKVGLLPNDRGVDEIKHHDMGNTTKVKVESRARRAIEKRKSSHYMLLFLALLGSCLIIADGVLTPAISVLSASSGLERSLVKISHIFSSSQTRRDSIEKGLKKFVPVPTACAILVGLFTLQHCGTRKIGFMFAPIVIIWLLFISGVGLYNIFHFNHKVISAISPLYMYRFIKNINTGSWKLLGSIVLCLAGSESMFADLGHFSKKSIKFTFVFLIYPALILCYAGQTAFISKNLGTSDDIIHLSESVPYKHLGVSEYIHHAFVVLSLLASAVGSQATITATFSIINQCQALCCFPRVKVVHTSDEIRGQIYIPDVNWMLMILSLVVTIGFHDISRIGYATGLAIISGMLVTTCLMSLVIALYWEKSFVMSAYFLVFFGSIEVMYLSSSLLNFPRGVWFLVLLLLLLLTIMISWHYGILKKYQFDFENKVPVDWLTELSPGLQVSRVPGIGFIYTDIVTGIPAFFSHFITNLPAFHQVLIFVSFKSSPVPHIPPSQRYLIGRVGTKEYKIYRCVVRYGYCDHVKDTDDFEDSIIHSIGEFILREEQDLEALTSPEGRLIVVGNVLTEANALISTSGTHSSGELTPLTITETLKKIPVPDSTQRGGTTVRRKKVRFTLPPDSPRMNPPVREELQELADARESGTAYFLGQSHLSVRNGSNLLKRFLIMSFIFLDKNCREPPVALNISHAALLEVGMVYTV